MAESRSKKRAPLFAWGGSFILLAAFVLLLDVWQVRYASEMRDRRPETYLHAAEKAMNMGRYEDALTLWSQAYNRAPEFHYTYKVLGDIHYNMKSWSKAEDAYRHALRLKSPMPGVRSNLLWCLVELGRYPEAIEFGKSWIAAGNASPDMYRRTAEACFRGKRFSDAIPLYEEALKGFPTDLYLMEHLRQSCQVVADFGRSKELEKEIAQLQSKVTVTPEQKPAVK